MGQRQIHVVPAQEDVIADSHARQHELTRLFADGDEGQVGGAAAQVADQDDVADFHLLAPPVLADVDPGVKRGLRLLEQRQLFQSRSARGRD